MSEYEWEFVDDNVTEFCDDEHISDIITENHKENNLSHGMWENYYLTILDEISCYAT